MIIVEELMTPDPVVLAPTASLAQVRQLMSERKIRHIPIVDGNTLVGLVTERDALAAMDSVLDPEKPHNQDNTPVEAFMTREPKTVEARDSLRSAALFMEKHRYGCMPVMNEGRLAGIITDTDFVALAINLIEQLDVEIDG